MNRSSLHVLAARAGILPAYIDQSGGEERVASDETRVALLAAMGFDASSEDAARRSLEALDARERRRVIDPARVATGETSTIPIRPPEEWRGRRVEYRCEIRGERGQVAISDGAIEPGADTTIRMESPIGLGLYDVRLALAAGGATVEAEQRLIVAPAACVTPSRRAFGIIANLYSLRSAQNWGVGNFSDLGALAEWSASRGAVFVGVNPLHALRNRGLDFSPYAPVSRLYRNPIYLDVEAIPELTESSEARAALASEAVRTELAQLRASDRVDYERIATLERPLLAMLFRAFVLHHRGRGDARDLAYLRYVEQAGEPLTTFARFCALEAHFTDARPHPPPWREWPAPYRDPASAEVAAFAESHRDEIDFHRWVQFELDRQLGEAARRGHEAGLSIGLYQDLAIGTAPSGSDTWAYPDLFASGVELGAPPDDYSAVGQNWGLPPIDPHRLRESGYRYWTAILRSALRHTGALRIDHMLGLFRQFWIPAGKTGREGAYVRFPTDDLLGVLALESVRHHALIVGEDLGTVPPEVPPTLRRWNILATRVLLFERDAAGAFRPAADYEPLSLATADTHDMAPLAGFWHERDIELRREVGLIETGEQLHAARVARQRERRALVDRLAADGALADVAREPTSAELRGAVHRFLCATPAVLVGIALDDLTGETEPVNIPGLGLDRFPSWTRRMHMSIDDLRDNADIDAALSCDRGARP